MSRDRETEEQLIMVPVGPVIDVSVCQIGLLAIRYSLQQPPRYVFMLQDARSEWTMAWVN